MTDTKTNFGIVLSNKTYDVLKGVTTTVLPAAATLYAGLAVFWGFPKPVEVCGSITLLATFLGVVLGLSAKQFKDSDQKYDGNLNIANIDGVAVHQIELTKDPGPIQDKKDFVLRVNPTDPSNFSSPPRS